MVKRADPIHGRRSSVDEASSRLNRRRQPFQRWSRPLNGTEDTQFDCATLLLAMWVNQRLFPLLEFGHPDVTGDLALVENQLVPGDGKLLRDFVRIAD